MIVSNRFTAFGLVMALQLSFCGSSMAQGSALKRIWNRVSGQTAPAPSYNTAPSPQAAYTPAPSAQAQVQAQPQGGGDPYGFGAILNQYRASAGLPPLTYCPNLSAMAVQNNSAMCRKGLGHHVVGNCVQNSGWNYANALAAARGWIDSPAHRANMLSPNATRFGIAHGPGPYWTLNAQ